MTVPPSKSDALPAEPRSFNAVNRIDTGPPPQGPRICDSNDTGTHHWPRQYQWTSIAGTLGLRDRLCSNAAVADLAALSERILLTGKAVSAWSTTHNGVESVFVASKFSVGSLTASTVSQNSVGHTVPAKLTSTVHTSTTDDDHAANDAEAVTIRFEHTVETAVGETILLVGSVPQLGSWDTESAIALSAAYYPTWTALVVIPSGTMFEYKFTRKDTDGNIVWESGPNRSAITPASGSQALTTTWR
ncbi:carbohydrate-binding-like protein [Fomes fomentarius]|nr:carbohydrate-binding-like protein [Fomes fomentarius]